MLDEAVYLYTAQYQLLDPRDTQYGLKMTCHFLIITTLLLVSPIMAPLSQYDTRQKCADKILGYTDRPSYIPRHVKIRPLPTLEGWTQKSGSTAGKLVDDLEVVASPCHVGDSRYSTIQSTLLNHTSFTLVPTCIFAHRRLALCDIYVQSINRDHYTSPFHGRVYREVCSTAQNQSKLYVVNLSVRWDNRSWLTVIKSSNLNRQVKGDWDRGIVTFCLCCWKNVNIDIDDLIVDFDPERRTWLAQVMTCLEGWLRRTRAYIRTRKGEIDPRYLPLGTTAGRTVTTVRNDRSLCGGIGHRAVRSKQCTPCICR